MPEYDPVGTVGFFRERLRVESITTAKVLLAMNDEMLAHRPHPSSSAAGETAWGIVRCLRVCNELLRCNTAEMPREKPPAHAVLTSEFEVHTLLLQNALSAMTQHQWEEERSVTSGGVEVLRQPLGQILWLFLFDAIHHRGQLSVYLRPLGARVPSIYGPSGDYPR